MISVPALAQLPGPDTVIHGVRCERTIEYFGDRHPYIGSTLDFFVKKILPDGSLADYLPSQRFALVIRSPHNVSAFVYPNGTSSRDTFNVALPVRVQAAEAGLLQAYAFALMNGDTSYLPLTVTSKADEPYLLQQSAQIKMKRKHYEQSRADLLRAAELDTAGKRNYYYDIACSYSLEGEKEKALEWLRTSIEGGFDNYVHALKNDTDLEPLRRLPEFRGIVTGPLLRERAKLTSELNARPEAASKNLIKIAGSFLTQGDIDSFYVSLESALQRGHIPGSNDFSGIKGFDAIKDDNRLHALFKQYVSPVLLQMNERQGGLSQRLGARKTEGTLALPVVNPQIKLLAPSATSPTAMILLQTGDSLVGRAIFSLDWKDKAVKELGQLSVREAQKASRISASWKGVIAFETVVDDGKQKLVVRSGSDQFVVDAPFHEAYHSGGSVEEVRSFPAFELSPDGKAVVACAKRELFVVDTGDGTLFTQFLVANLNVGASTFDAPRVDTFATRGYDADSRFERLMVGWDPNNPHVVLFQDVYPHQLWTEVRHLWSYDTAARKYKLIAPDIQNYFSSSSDGRYLLSTNNDETCCSGVNYDDNLLMLYDTRSRKETILFDEWSRFRNEGKPEEHEPRRAAMSPDGKWVVTTIRNLYDPAGHSTGSETGKSPSWGEVTADVQLFLLDTGGKVHRVFSNRDFIGWLDNTHALLTQRVEKFREPTWTVTDSELRVLDVESGIEMPLLMTSAECLAIQWRTVK
jgi:tetratricopeptide (TPR) repeat protein